MHNHVMKPDHVRGPSTEKQTNSSHYDMLGTLSNKRSGLVFFKGLAGANSRGVGYNDPLYVAVVLSYVGYFLLGCWTKIALV